MKIILSITLLFLFSFSSAWALPECEGSPYKGDDLSQIKHWDNCEGTLTLNDGNKYVGEFKDGLTNGQGTLTLYDGNKYVGEFKDGEQNGQGTFTWADGAKYVGEWKDGKRNGQGTFTFPDGRIQEGQWRNGKYVGKKEYEDEVLKLEEVEELYKNKVITDEERKKMRNKILGID